MPQHSAEAICIHRLSDTEPARFAAAELRRYLKRMTGRPARVLARRAYKPETPGLWLGTADAFPGVIPTRVAAREHPFDDVVYVRATPEHVVLAGGNPRSTVFAAYRYLEELGCRWLRPGRDGERVPRVPKALWRTFALAEVPTSRHRCICIEGSCSEQHVRAMIDYVAKRGFNSYFFQFFVPHQFFNRWYGFEQPRGGKAPRFTPADSARIRDRLKAELRRRGMIIHSVGHGWTAEPLGLEANEWVATKKAVPKRYRPLLAKVNGRRALWRDMSIVTQLCLSNPRARTLMAKAVADYAAAHQDEEVVHFWLGDAANNYCECEKCAQARPTDFYVMMLNELDELLTARRLSTRIVFLAYFNSLWAPRRAKIKNPDRFILMFAPMSRSYDVSLRRAKAGQERPGRYLQNKTRFPASPAANLELLAGWRRSFTGDIVDFDYHLWSPVLSDPSHIGIAHVLFEDCCDMTRLDMCGFISCQQTRICLPTGLLMHLMGKALWDARGSYSRTVDDYLADVFCKRGPAVRAYLEKLSRLFRPLGRDGLGARGKALRRAERSFVAVPKELDRFLPIIERGCRLKDKPRAAAWRLLREHGAYVRLFAGLCEALCARDRARACDTYARLLDHVRRHLPSVHHVFDTHIFLSWARRMFGRAGMSTEGLPGRGEWY